MNAFIVFRKFLRVFLLIAVLTAPCAAIARTAEDQDVRGGVVLVLSGGGTKGFAHVGVLNVLEREGIPIAGIVGTSIGSVIGGLYACGYSADELREIIQGTNILGLLADSGTRLKVDAGDHRPAGESARLLRVTLDSQFRVSGPRGILPAISLTSFLTEYTGHLQTTDFDELPIPFACVAADLETGEEVVFREGNLASTIRASASIPGLLEPWPIGGRLLVDGGLVANLPVLIAKEMFPGYPVVAVNLAGESINKPRESLTNVVDVMMQTIDIMTVDRIKENEAAADLVIYPELTEFGMLDPSGYEKIFESGYIAANDSVDRLIELSVNSKEPPIMQTLRASTRNVRNVRILGLHKGITADLEKRFSEWIGKPYDVNLVNDERDRISNLDEVASVHVETFFQNDGAETVDIVFSVERRPAFEITAGGYTANFNPNRWISLDFNARDFASDGDSAVLNMRYGNEEWGADVRYFTPLMNGRHWGFSLSASKNDYELYGFDPYSLRRYSTRIIYYHERMGDTRIGLGLAGDYVRGHDYDKFRWGPYLYFNRDTLDNLLLPSRGHSINAKLWLNENAFVSRSTLTAYMPYKANMLFLLNFGLETGKLDNTAYRAVIGDAEELISLSRHPFAGDQTFWARVGMGRDFLNSWWGAARGEIFAAYGAAMEDWRIERDMWEAGVGLSIPGQVMSGRLMVVYNSNDEFVFGFSLGNSAWRSDPMP